MRVHLDSIIFGLQKVGGITTYWTELCRYLSRNPDVELHLKMPRSRSGAAASDTFTRHTTTDYLPTKIARYLPSCAGRGAIHHSSYYRNPCSPLAISVITVYDFVYERVRTGLARAIHAWQKRSAICRANGVLCISENTRHELLNLYPDVDPRRVRVTPLGVAPDRFFPPSVDEVDPALADAVVFVGKRDKHKCFDLAVEAVARVRGLRLAIVGDDLTGNESGFLERHLVGRFLTLGRLSDEVLRRTYGSCFALIYPSSYEGFGLPILEAMACGCPVVTNRLSSLPEVGGNAALYSDSQAAEGYTEQLARLTGPSLRASAASAGISRSQLFQWNRTFSDTIQLYRDLVAANGDLCK